MSESTGQIIAIGGGGFGRSIYNTRIDNYILEQCPKEKPNICFIPTASAEDKAYTVNFYAVYSKRSCNPTHINFFQRTPRLDSIIKAQFYVVLAQVLFVGLSKA
jgi:dipeptidase E